jgi:hypothetical protein
VHLVKINPEVFHFPLHILVFHADLYHLGVTVAPAFAHRLEHLAIQNCRAARAAILGKQPRSQRGEQPQYGEGEKGKVTICVFHAAIVPAILRLSLRQRK